MLSSRERIITSHVGSLPRPDDLIEAYHAREIGAGGDEQAFQSLLQSSVSDVVKRQRQIGITVLNDGEFGKSMGHRVNYRAWLSYIFHRLDGIEVPTSGSLDAPPRQARAEELVPVDLNERRDRVKFIRAYTDPDLPISTGPRRPARPVCTGPVKYSGHAAIRADIVNLTAAMDAHGITEGFMSSIGPGSASRVGNLYYRTDEEFMFACADALQLPAASGELCNLPRQPEQDGEGCCGCGCDRRDVQSHRVRSRLRSRADCTAAACRRREAPVRERWGGRPAVL
jgi:5-methyltetrahydropteroyltriglutamate--homocysteine methyltransferase